MLYETSIAFKYLLPRWRQLSVSIISLVSTLVIALVVWLILVFFSVTNGLEKTWISKISALTAPIRVIPTDDYYQSYYYNVDSLSSSSDFTLKSIGEKTQAPSSEPYNPSVDQELPANWPKPDLDANGKLKDLVKLAYAAIHTLDGTPGLQIGEYEMTFGNLRLNLSNGGSTLAQAAYFGSLDPHNASLKSVLVPITKTDILEGLHNMSKGRAQPSLWYQVQNLPNGQIAYHLPKDPVAGEGVLLPKAFREAGVRLGDFGSILYYAPTASSVQEQRLPIYVAGFYDPGIMPMGGKFVLVNPSVTNLIRSSHNQEDTTFSNGINLRFQDLDQADAFKAKLNKAFEAAGIDRYWSIQTYRDFDFTKDLMQQMRSDKHLFLLIATIIIIVACSNIISMLIILVNDKKKEIGILRSMGASSYSVAAIFGLCGMLMGIIGSLLGCAAAYFTLKNIGVLTSAISNLQGYEAFNPLYYGDVLPNQMSAEALVFVSLTTGLISLLAGVIPAVKASMLRPSAILRSE